MRANRFWAAGAVVALLVLSGCVRVQVDFTIQPDDTVDGVMLTSVSEAYLSADGYSHEALLDVIKPDDYSNWPGTITSEGEYKQDGYYGYEIAFSDGTLAEFASEGSLEVHREQDVFTFLTDVEGALEGSGLTPQEQETADVRLTVTFPGEVLTHNGSEVIGNTVVWLITPGSDGVLEASGSGIANGQATAYTPAPRFTEAPQPDPERETLPDRLVEDTPEVAPEVDPRLAPFVGPEFGSQSDEDAAAPVPESVDSSLPDDANHPAIYVVSGLVLVLVAGGIAYVLLRRRAAGKLQA